jgi:signal transduction histidine kinase
VCQIKESFRIAEYYLEDDKLNESQKWLYVTDNLNNKGKTDTTSIFINSLQSELFYYNGLYQFGVNEAEKVIIKSKQLKDSLLISNGYFFKAINLFELQKLKDAEKMIWKSKNFQPIRILKKQLRSPILKEHIYNNLAQIKLQLQQIDSAIYYNSKAYLFAKKNNSKRGIPNIEQTFGQIYLDQRNNNEAIYYFQKSTVSATKNNYFDIALANYGYLMLCYPNNFKNNGNYFNRGLALITLKKINISFQILFYKTAVIAFKKNNDLENLAFSQEQLIKMNEKISLSNNDYIQNITKQYIKNENKLLKQELNLTKSIREKQIFYLLIGALTLISIALAYFFKQRQRLKNQEIDTLKQNQEITNLESLIDGEEKERKRIAQELHDGLNGDLSAIKYRLCSLDDAILKDEERESLLKSILLIDSACAQVRSISHNLIPTSILDFGLVETVEQYCAKLSNANPLKLDFQYFGNPAFLNKKTETVIYRIIQELINNIYKHSRATTALVQLNFHENELFITVEDNGIGFDVKTVQNGLGLKNIRSRIHFLAANLDIVSNKKGTSYHINVDLNTLKND